MQDLIAVENKPGYLNANFDEFKEALQTELARYDVVVTADTLKDAKALSTEINKTKAVIDRRRKDEVAKASAPVREFDDLMKELVAMCDEGREKLTSQIKCFEDETRAQARTKLEAYRAEAWDAAGVDAEFRRAKFDDLAIVSALTGKGNLAASAKRKLDDRISADKALQDQTRMRLLELETKSYRAGLHAPLTRDHVAAFLFADSSTYEAELDRVLAAEIKRQEQSEAVVRARHEKEDARAQQEAAAQAAEPEQSTMYGYSGNQPRRAPAEGKAPCTVTCVFSVDVPADATEGAIAQTLRKRLTDAGFTSLSSIEVEKQLKKSEAA